MYLVVSSLNEKASHGVHLHCESPDAGGQNLKYHKRSSPSMIGDN